MVKVEIDNNDLQAIDILSKNNAPCDVGFLITNLKNKIAMAFNKEQEDKMKEKFSVKTKGDK